MVASSRARRVALQACNYCSLNVNLPTPMLIVVLSRELNCTVSTNLWMNYES